MKFTDHINSKTKTYLRNVDEIVTKANIILLIFDDFGKKQILFFFAKFEVFRGSFLWVFKIMGKQTNTLIKKKLFHQVDF